MRRAAAAEATLATTIPISESGPISDAAWLRRAPVVAIYDVRDATVVLGRDGSGQRFDGDSAHLVRAILDTLARPMQRRQLVAALGELAGAPLEDTTVVDQALGLLVAAGAVEVLADPSAASRPRPPGARVVLGITGAVATAHAPSLVAQLIGQGHSVRVAATPEAMRFVRAESLEALTHAPVTTAMWTGTSGLVVPHIALAQWADVVVVCPASATTIGRLATGDFSSIVSAVALATTAPVVVVPSMNTAMLEAEAVQRNLRRIADDGMHVVHPAHGTEVALSPHLRTPILGASPPPSVVGRIVDAVLAGRPARARIDAPEVGLPWDEVYRTTPEDRLPWHAAEVDPDLAAELERLAPVPTDVLDIGTGLGSLASACARAGHRVVAIDVSSVAIGRAADRAAGLGITWIVGDVTDGPIHGDFGVLVDRACLHMLGDDARRRYAKVAARLCRPGGALLLKIHDEAAAAARSTHAISDAELRERFAPAFTVERVQPSEMPGPMGSVGARLVVLRRVGD